MEPLFRMMVAMFVHAKGGTREDVLPFLEALGKYDLPVTALQAWDQLELAWDEVAP